MSQYGVVTRRLSSSLFPWLLCIAFLAWGWRVRNPFRELPSSGDALEVIWGMEWYHDALFVSHTSPLYTPFIFHPNGWHTATLAHTPALFLMAQPFRAIGGAAFAYNALAILSFIVAFFGCIRLFRMFNSSSAIVAVSAAVFTFVNFRWFRANGHHHILWASSFLPWFLWGLEKARRASGAGIRDAIFPGVMWGLMISFSLYSVFLGAVGFAIWGRQLLMKVRLKQALAVAALALIVGGPTLVVYEIGKHADEMENFSAAELVSWSASLNSLPIPSVFHPIPAVRHFAEAAYNGPKDESGVANLGIVTFACAIAGAWLA